jgi:tetratricopeptide (TPR) repeat protein
MAMLLWGSVLTLAALILAALPLFGLLGYESAFVLGLGITLAATHLGARAVFRWRARLPLVLAEREGIDARPLRALMQLVAGQAARALGLLVLPVLVLALNALRVKNCNLAAGLAWALVLPGVSALTATVAGVAAGLGSRRSGRAILLGLGIILGSVGWSLARAYTAPPIFAFDPFGGYFPGSLYDEEVAISGTVLGARALHLGFALAALTVLAPFLDGHTLGLRWRAARGRTALKALALVAGGAAALALHLEPRLGLAPDAASIARALGGRRETAHLVLLYSPSGPWARDIDLHAEDAEFRWHELADFFGVTPSGKITCYLFADAAEKRRHTGAGHTQVAKPWRREIYLQHDSWPHGVIKHELAHVFAGEFGDPLLHVARRGLVIDAGLIEGVAVAAEDRAEHLTLDQSVQVMRRADLEPPLAQVLGPGFYAFSASRAYTLAGSFVRFLIEAHGIERFRALYRNGGDYVAAYGRPLGELGAEWSRRIDATTVSEADHQQALERLRRPGILHKVCAHELALRAEEARTRSARGDWAGALALYESLCTADPDDPGHLATLMNTHAAAHHEREAEKSALALLRHPKASPAQRVSALTFLGDLRLRKDPTEAAARYRQALDLKPAEATARQLRARLLAATGSPQAPGLGPALARYLVGDPPGSPPDGALALLRAREITLTAPESGLGHYLLGRQLLQHNQMSEAVGWLGRSLELGLPDPGFAIEARRQLGLAALRSGDRGRAREVFAALAADGTAPPEVRGEARDMVKRCDFRPRP